ncbi:MAG: nucleoside phosphorylase [Thermoprotei archaeon]|nr:MAG: nucleoside phosphorylase [Thermoprotei archaeon]
MVRLLCPLHIRARPEDIAPRIIIAGDPARVRQVADILENAKLVNRNRDLLVYTGEYKGIPISVAVHGIGAPSLAIVLEELIMLGAKAIVRLGTAGALVEDLHIGDVVIPTGASYTVGGTLGMYVPEPIALACVPDFNLLCKLVDEMDKHEMRYKVGPVFSSDAFYAEDPKFAKKWAERGYLAVEMECATLFALGLMRKVHCAATLIISDSLVLKEEKELKTAEELREYVDKVARVILNALIKFKV